MIRLSGRSLSRIKVMLDSIINNVDTINEVITDVLMLIDILGGIFSIFFVARVIRYSPSPHLVRSNQALLLLLYCLSIRHYFFWAVIFIIINITIQSRFASMYHFLLFISYISVFIRGQLVLSISFPTDDLDALSPLFGDDASSSSSLFTDDLSLNNDDEFSTTTIAGTAPNSCAAVAPSGDLSLSQDDTSLVSRDENNGAECLPPVNIGAATLELFETPLDSLENTVFPLKGQTSDDSLPGGYPGLLPDGERGSVDPQEMGNEGWKPYEGDVRVEIPPQSRACAQLTFLRGIFTWELCCDSAYYGYEPSSESERSVLARVDFWSKRNQNIAVIFNCICTFLNNHGECFPKVFSKRKFDS